MTETFATKVQSIVGPALARFGFEHDATEEGADEGGRKFAVEYFRSDDCKLQVYQSEREGSINCMIATLDAPNTFGPRDRSPAWQYLPRFATGPRPSFDELIQRVSFEFKTDEKMLEGVVDTLSTYFEDARRGILDMHRNP